jgi:hypothetical protein
MTPSSAQAPPSNEFADGIALRFPQRAFHQAGLKAKVRFNELGNLAVLFREL